MGLNHNVWLPKLKFTLQTIAVMYPQKPNTVTKKKYYEFIQNLPIFIPIAPIGKNFIKLLDEFPVTPYLDKRKDFIKWVHFIFNKINKQNSDDKVLQGSYPVILFYTRKLYVFKCMISLNLTYKLNENFISL